MKHNKKGRKPKNHSLVSVKLIKFCRKIDQNWRKERTDCAERLNNLCVYIIMAMAHIVYMYMYMIKHNER